MEEKYLTKSKFSLAMECPRKLYYIDREEYLNKRQEDPFLEALADGGFQVAELAKIFYPLGENMEKFPSRKALEKTKEALGQKNVRIYEAAIEYENCFIRVDILDKRDRELRLIEVKSKSISSNIEEEFLTKKGKIKGGWKPYLHDLAFQKYVLEGAYPDLEVRPYLYLVNKETPANIDGLNQKFKISRDRSTGQVILAEDIGEVDIDKDLLKLVDASNYCDLIYEENYKYCGKEFKFVDLISYFSKNYAQDILMDSTISRECKNCQFKASDQERAQGFKSGFHECFMDKLNWKEEDFLDDSVFDLWDNRRLNRHLNAGLIKLKDLDKDDIGFKEGGAGLSRTERQWLQIKKSKNKDRSSYIDRENLRKEMEGWTYPLHFIDFETASPALPFNKGMRPYEGIAFQFSHHIVTRDGRVSHWGEYLSRELGSFPNFEFIRELKKSLSGDRGTIFRYGDHENTYLNMIYEQIMERREELEDWEELTEFIIDITRPPSNLDGLEIFRPDIVGERNMVDMLELIKKYYYNPYMKGSNSIKAVLPAVLNTSKFLQDKYSRPIYGARNGISSHNFKDWVWIKSHKGRIRDPYDLLPKFSTSAMGEIKDGAAAMNAYESLQFQGLSSEERESLEKGLLKYCELDTLAMVMIYEAWREMIF